MTEKVTVVQTGAVREIDFTEGMTVKQAIAAADLQVSENHEVRLNGSPCPDHDTVLKAGDQVMIVGQIAGA
ncbi:MoaD/ThiS family protein [Candidatus Kaiserbacteria bacterium]|nr:MoaD/ThiS family protein [Candidatus Kaiserbacteria bacterium]